MHPRSSKPRRTPSGPIADRRSLTQATVAVVPRKYVWVDGVATLVHHRGATTLPGHPPDLSTGPPIVCLHGAGGNGNEFGAVLDALESAFSPLAYDQPGHGRSASLDSLGSIEAMAAH